MKTLFCILLLISTQTFAVIVSKCPQELNINIPNVATFTKNFVDDQTKFYDYDQVDHNSINNFLSKTVSSFSFVGELTDTTDSVCSYRSLNGDSNFNRVRISGTDKKTNLVMDFEDNKTGTKLTLYAFSTSTKPKYGFSGSTAQIKAEAWGESWGDTYLVNISVGKGTIN